MLKKEKKIKDKNNNIEKSCFSLIEFIKEKYCSEVTVGFTEGNSEPSKIICYFPKGKNKYYGLSKEKFVTEKKYDGFEVVLKFNMGKIKTYFSFIKK